MVVAPKVLSIAELAARLKTVRADRGGSARRVVHCHGVFDLLHIGHIRYLQQARRFGDLLVVTITPDEYVNKGPHRPAFQARLRADALAALDCVDYVGINEWPTALETIRLLKPDVYAKGGEFRDHKTPELRLEEEAAQEVGAQVEFIDEFTSSSSYLLNKYLTPFDDETERYLLDFRERFGLEQVTAVLDRARQLSVLVVGEAIIDEYYSCAAIGRSAKAPILSTQYNSHNRFAGGALAVANHLATLCGRVDLLSMLGADDQEEPWIRDHLADTITARFLRKSNSPTIVKRRYRESYFGSPLFAINFLSDSPLLPQEDDQLVKMLTEQIDAYDLVLVADYGHHMITTRAIEAVTEKAAFLAINTQANAANIGFHTVSKYPRADFVALAERELRLECRSRTGSLTDQLSQVASRLSTELAIVTLGKQGCLCLHHGDDFHQAASLATAVVDRIGAGDAFLAISAMAAALRVPPEVVAFLGNVAGAEAVAYVGNSRSIEDGSLRRHIASLFK